MIDFCFQAEDGIRDIGVTGVQTCALPILIASIRNWATKSQIRLSTSGMDANSPNRRTSQTTIVLRRSNRSANAPASGPRTIRTEGGWVGEEGRIRRAPDY